MKNADNQRLLDNKRKFDQDRRAQAILRRRHQQAKVAREMQRIADAARRTGYPAVQS